MNLSAQGYRVSGRLGVFELSYLVYKGKVIVGTGPARYWPRDHGVEGADVVALLMPWRWICNLGLEVKGVMQKGYTESWKRVFQPYMVQDLRIWHLILCL